MRINPAYFVRAIIVLLFLLDLYWAWRADRRLRSLPRAGPWRVLSAAFVVGEMSCLLLLLFDPHAVRGVRSLLPTPVLAAVYLWHLLILPATLLLGFAGRLLAFVTRPLWRPRAAPTPDIPPAVRWGPGGTGLPPAASHAAPSVPPASPAPLPPTPAPAMPMVFTRRKLLGAAAVAAPVLALGGGVWKGLSQIGQFRRRDLTLVVPQLPAALEGLVIAHVSDLHVGRFMRPAMLPAVVDAVNRLDADLILLTGDLIDFSIDDLPAALDAVRRLRSRHGLAMCLGNHDVIEDSKRFIAETRNAGVPLLVDETHTLFIRRDGSGGPGAGPSGGGSGKGKWAEVQLLGTSWAGQDAEINARFKARIVPARSPTAFPIVLAHHPHAFDPAAAAGFPLTLCGHTHGGQLMATPNLGAGPLIYRYWSGPYIKGQGPNTSHLVVSNGVGNWFPLRLNAPAEIIRLTLTAGASV